VLAADLGPAALAESRTCAEAMYRCEKATLVFIHAHKGGGTSFVSMARANGAGLAKLERNGDPVEATSRWPALFPKGKSDAADSPRVRWWDMPPAMQRDWFARLRGHGVRFVSTEKGFPAYSTGLLAPSEVLYAIVVREPASRFVSYYFWRYRANSFARKVAAKLMTYDVATLRPGAPTFHAFVESENPLDGYYVRRLAGSPEGKDAPPVDAAMLRVAEGVLADVFSVVLVTDRLGDLGPVVDQVLGWPLHDFSAFHAKSNPAPDAAKLEAWRADWRPELQRRMPLDVELYTHAKKLCEQRLARATRATASVQKTSGDFSVHRRATPSTRDDAPARLGSTRQGHGQDGPRRR